MRLWISALLVMLGAILAGAEALTVPGNGFELRCDEEGVVEIVDSHDQQLMRFSGVLLEGSPYSAVKGSGQKIDQDTLQVDYHVIKDGRPAQDGTKMSGTFQCQGAFVVVRFALRASDGVNINAAMLLRQSPFYQDSSLIKAGLWERRTPDSVAYEVNDGIYRRYDGDYATLLSRLNGSPEWQGPDAQHFKMAKAEIPYMYTGECRYLVSVKGLTDAQLAAEFNQRELSLEILSDQVFNLWDAGSEDPQLTVAVGNATGTELDGVTISTRVRDYDGNLLVDQEEKADLSPWQDRQIRLSLPVKDLPGVYFVDVKAGNGREQRLASTMVGVMTPYDFQHKDSSLIGISAYFYLPSKEAVLDLLKRVGVAWFRHGDARETKKLADARSNGFDVKYLFDHPELRDPAKRDEYFAKLLEQCVTEENYALEMGNEWNGAQRDTGANSDLYTNYWLKPIMEMRDKQAPDLKIISLGLGGPDVAFLKGICDNGGWEKLDGLALHPGRGNFTADYTGDYWSYLGAIEAIETFMDEHGRKPLWLTEVYACTMPNSDWHDSYRQAADAIVLQLAIAKAKNVKAAMVYQLQDSVWFDQGGVNHEYNEYFYGLLDRKSVIKPSLLAFKTIAEALDGATFTGELAFDDDNIKGLLFDTPKGPMAVLWSRIDGYIHNDRPKDFTSPEPWVSQWKQVSPVTLPCSGEGATLVDVIGRKQTVPALDGNVSLELDGSPWIVYGLELNDHLKP